MLYLTALQLGIVWGSHGCLEICLKRWVCACGLSACFGCRGARRAAVCKAGGRPREQPGAAAADVPAHRGGRLPAAAARQPRVPAPAVAHAHARPRQAHHRGRDHAAPLVRKCTCFLRSICTLELPVRHGSWHVPDAPAGSTACAAYVSWVVRAFVRTCAPELVQLLGPAALPCDPVLHRTCAGRLARPRG